MFDETAVLLLEALIVLTVIVVVLGIPLADYLFRKK